MPSNIEYQRIQDDNKELKSNEKFLFVFTPNCIAQDSCCGCSLKTSAQIISILQIISSLSNFVSALNQESNFSLFINGLLFIAYFSAGALTYFSTINRNYRHCYMAYLIYATIFIINLIDSIIMSSLIFAGIYNPFYDLDNIRSGLLYVTSSLIVKTVQLYFVWIIYSYAMSLKNNDEYEIINQAQERNERLI